MKNHIDKMAEVRRICAQRLAAVRRQRRMTQRDLAERSGLGHRRARWISHFETGMRLPTLITLLRLAESLDVSVDYLLGRTEDPAVSSNQFGGTPLSAKDRELVSLFTAFLVDRANKSACT